MKRKQKNRILIGILCLAAATAAAFGTKLYLYYKGYETDRIHYRKLCEDVVTVVSTSQILDEKEEKILPRVEEQTNSEQLPIAIDWEKLKQINSDIIGWVYFSGLKQISYPILQAADNSYYLNRTYDLSDESSKAGSIFMDYRMKSDFSSPYTIIYGHNMRDGSMFSDLAKLKDQTVYETDPYFWILTPNNGYRYRIISVFECDRSADVFQNTFEVWDDMVEEWKQELVARSTINPIQVEMDEKNHPIIVFSTCVPNSFNRTIVCGIRN